MRFLKRFILLFFFSAVAQLSYSQIWNQLTDTRDIGFMIGSSQYMGDVNQSNPYYRPYPSVSFLYKQSYNNFYSFRIGITYAQLQGFDSDFSNMYQKMRKYSFVHNDLFEFSSIVELNFLKYTLKVKEKNFTPYILGGVALFYSEDLTPAELISIPMGIGAKYRITKKSEINVEWAFRKTFTDNLDLMETTLPTKIFKQSYFYKNNDWYSVLGITFLFNIVTSKTPCSVPKKKSYEYRLKKRKQR